MSWLAGKERSEGRLLHWPKLLDPKLLLPPPLLPAPDYGTPRYSCFTPQE